MPFTTRSFSPFSFSAAPSRTARSSRAQTLPEKLDLSRARPPTLRLPVADALGSGAASAAASPATTPRLPTTARSSPPLPPLPPLPRPGGPPPARAADGSATPCATPRAPPAAQTPRTSFVFNDVFVSDADLLAELLAIGAAESNNVSASNASNASASNASNASGVVEDAWPALCFVGGADRDGARSGVAAARLFAPALVRQRREGGYRAWCHAMREQALERLYVQARQQQARAQQVQQQQAQQQQMQAAQQQQSPRGEGHRARLARQHSSQALLPRHASLPRFAPVTPAAGAGSPRDAARVPLPSTQRGAAAGTYDAHGAALLARSGRQRTPELLAAADGDARRAAGVVSRPGRAATIQDIPLSLPASPRVAARGPRHSRAPDAPPALLLTPRQQQQAPPPQPHVVRCRMRSSSIQPDVPFRPGTGLGDSPLLSSIDCIPAYTHTDFTEPSTPSSSNSATTITSSSSSSSSYSSLS